MSTAWKDLTKQERVERMKAGREAAKASRQVESAPVPENPVDLATAIAQAFMAIQSAQATHAPKDPKDMTLDERKAEHERLQKALDELPFVAEHVQGVEPGTVIGTGLTAEYAPHTREWFLDVEARRKDRNFHNGQPAELRWPDYRLHGVIYQGTMPYHEVIVSGVGFALTPGAECLLPTPHYASYMDRMRRLLEHEQTFAQPDHPSMKAGYVHVKYSANGRMLAVLLGKGPLASITEREANDRPATA